MPFRATRPCQAPGGCAGLARSGRFCAAHAGTPAAKPQFERWRGSAASRGYDAAWRRTRLFALQRDKHLCQDCLRATPMRLTTATEVHHEVPIETDPSRRLDLTNLRSLCKACHSGITATRDSAFAAKGPRDDSPR